MFASASPDKWIHCCDGPRVTASEVSEVNARPTRSPDHSRPVRTATVPPLLVRTGTKNVRSTEPS
jgi:hypothetical protein